MILAVRRRFSSSNFFSFRCYHFITMQLKFKKNLDISDRAIRGATALVLLCLYLSGIIHGIIANILMILACMLTLSGALGYCPLINLFGFNNNNK